MGKNWKGHQKGGGGKGGADLASIRGFACVAGTCDGAREREANRELVNLLNDALEELYPVAEASTAGADAPEMSCMDALQAELAAVRSQSHTATQRVRTINTGIKGYVIARISCREACPVRLVKHMFDRVEKTRLPVARNLVRVFPLQHTFYPNEEELKLAVAACMLKEFNYARDVPAALMEDADAGSSKRLADEAVPDGEEGEAKKLKLDSVAAVTDSVAAPDAASAVATQPIVSGATPVQPKMEVYNLTFNRRMNDVISKQQVLEKIWGAAPAHLRYNYKIFKGAFVVEIFKNVAGISYVRDFADSLHDLNIRKFQASFGLSIDSSKPKKERVVEGSTDVNIAKDAAPVTEEAPADKGSEFIDYLRRKDFQVVVFDMDCTMSTKHCGPGLLRSDLQSYIDAASPDFVAALRALAKAKTAGQRIRCAVATGSDPAEYELEGQSKETHILGPDLAAALISHHCPEALDLFDIMVGYDFKLHPAGEAGMSTEGKRHHMRVIREHYGGVPFEKMVLFDDAKSSLVNEDGWIGVKVDGSVAFRFDVCADVAAASTA